MFLIARRYFAATKCVLQVDLSVSEGVCYKSVTAMSGEPLDRCAAVQIVLLLNTVAGTVSTVVGTVAELGEGRKWFSFYIGSNSST